MVDVIRELARALVQSEPGGFDPSVLDRPHQELIDLAWAVKEEALAAWMEEPRLAQRCAEVAGTLAQRTQSPEVAAASAWCEGMAALALGRMEAAIAHFDAAHDQLVALGRSDTAPKTQIPKLVALSMLGRHEQAAACAMRVREQLIAAGDDLSAGKVELNLGSMLQRQDRYAEAAPYYRAAAARFARVGDVPHSILADINLAAALAWQFDFDEAVRLYARCEQRTRKYGLPWLQAIVDTNRGRLELQRGRFEPALKSLEAALRATEHAGMPQEVAETQRGLADAYLALNLLPEALAWYDRSLEISRELDAPIERAWAKLQRARALARQGNAHEAMQGIATARTLFEAQANPVGVALADLRSASLLVEQGAAAQALQRAEAARQVFAQAHVESWRCEADVIAARALALLGHSEPAQRQLEQTLDAAQGLLELEAACHRALADLSRERGDAQAARTQYERAVQCIELQRASLPGDEFRTSYGADKQAPYDALIELALDDADEGAPQRLMRCIERSSAQSLRTALGRGPEGAAGIGAEHREQLQWLHGQWQEAITQGDQQRAANLQARSRQLEHDVLEQQRRAAAASGTPGAVHAKESAAFDIGALQARLPAGAVLVEFALVGRRLAACIVDGERVTRVVSASEGIDARIEQLRFQIDSLRFGVPALRAHARQMAQRALVHLQALHAQVWQPIAPWVREAQHLVIVPHRSLHYVPFCALHDGQAHLVQQHEISLAPSAAVWLDQRLRPSGHGQPFRRVAALGIGGATLPHVAMEVQAVAAAFESLPQGSAVRLLDAQATQSALRAALPGADVLHMACHGQFRADSPYFSALHLADGPLTLRDASALPLQARLVALSACETGLSKVAPGDELLGLLRGFLMAGAPTVLATQWTVDDESTAALMTHFYRELLTGQSPATALRRAQCALLADHPHPYYWAPFAVHGQG